MASLWLITRLTLLVTLIPVLAHAFKLDPYSHLDKKQTRFVGGSALLSPIHEDITLRAIATARIDKEYKTDKFLKGIIRGVRWNDDPLNMAKNKPAVFLASFLDSCKNPQEIHADWDLLYRTHCGDMQFLHAMASETTENAGATRNKILMWAEFAFKVASGEISKDRRFRNMGIHFEQDSGVTFRHLLTNNGKTRGMWQPEWIFTLDCDRSFTLNGLFKAHPTKLSCIYNNNRFPEQWIQDIALGSLIHVLQDSFSGSHVTREYQGEIGISKLNGLGKIVKFGNFTMQDSKLHEKADLTIVNGSSTEGLDLTEISARLIELAIQQRLTKQPRWTDAKKILNAVFEVIDADQMPGSIGYK